MCVCVYMCVCMFIYIYMCVYGYIYIHMCVCVYIYVYVNMCVCICIYVCVYVCIFNTWQTIVSNLFFSIQPPSFPIVSMDKCHPPRPSVVKLLRGLSLQNWDDFPEQLDSLRGEMPLGQWDGTQDIS